MIKKVFLTVIIFLAIYRVSAQIGMPTIVPPSPEAASIFSFKETPVSLYSGLPNITIPLFEIETGGINLPISLSYNARGVKVADASSRVGTGWTLNAGGMVSRQIRGLLDNQHQYGIKNTYLDNGNIVFFGTPSKRQRLLNLYAGQGQEFDYLPDQFFYSTGTGIDGKFIFDYVDNAILPQKFSNVKFINSNTIVDGSGNTYYFDGPSDIDNTQVTYEMKQDGSYVSTPSPSLSEPNTWYLSKIVTQSGKEVNFTYVVETISNIRRSFDKFNTDPSMGQQYSSHCSYVETQQNRISEITFDKGKIIFYYASGREDMGGSGGILKAVRMFNTSGQLIESKLLEHHYTNSESIDGGNVNYNTDLKDLPARKRLFLDSVQTVSHKNSNLKKNPYKFEYNTTVLPSRHSNSQDLWGYYNGVDNGQFLTQLSGGVGARVVDVNKSEAGLLKKMVYPEGGSVNFYYEANKVYTNYPKSAIYLGTTSPTVLDGRIMSTMDHLQIDSLSGAPYYNPAGRMFRKKIVIPENIAGTTMSYTVDLSHPENCSISNNSSCKLKIFIRKQNPDNSESVVCELFHTPASPGLPAALPRPLPVLAPGVYFLTAQHTDSTYDPTIFPGGNFIININWDEFLDPNPGILFAGGKRIQKIEYKDENDIIGLVKTYDYNDPATGLSSGLLFGLPNYLGIKKTIGNFTLLHAMGNTPGSALSTYQDFSVGYGIVTEYIGEGNNTLGRSIYQYTMTPESNDFYTFPYHPPPDHEWLRGKEKKITHYKRTGPDSFLHVKEIENKYLYGDELFEMDEIDSSPSVFFSLPYRETLLNNLACPDPSSGEPIFLQCTNSTYLKNKRMFRLPLGAIYFEDETPMFKVFHLTGGTMDLLSTKTTDYFDNGLEMKSETRYFYDYDKHYNTSGTEAKTSDNKTLITKYLYANNSEMNTEPLISLLRNRNMVSIPLLTKTLLDDEPLSSQKTIYKNWGDISAGNPQIAPELLQVSKGDQPLETRIKYISIDPLNGNPQEVMQPNGIPVSYIWGYNKAYPIAKIENATYLQIQPHEANLHILSDNPVIDEVSEAQLLAALNNLRTLLPHAMVTTYTYKPLIGVSTITAPNGSRTTYEYDAFNRLEQVKDHNGKVLSKNEYYYAPQN